MDVTDKAAAIARRERTARAAMAALIESRSLSVREDEATYPHVLADIAWRIADAMHAERANRTMHAERANRSGRGKR